MAKNNLSLADLSRMRKQSRQSPSAKIKPDESNLVQKSEDRAIAKSRERMTDDAELKSSSNSQPSDEEPKKVGRPKSIRSNPDYESTTIRLHRQIKAKARYILATQPQKMDLQTLLNNLLEDFVRQ